MGIDTHFFNIDMSNIAHTKFFTTYIARGLGSELSWMIGVISERSLGA